MLERDPHKRLGAGSKGSDEIKAHSFFKSIDWQTVLNRQLSPKKPTFNLNVSKKNIPKDLMSDYQDPKRHLLGWSFAEEEQS